MSYYYQNFEDMLTLGIRPVCKLDLESKQITERHGDNSTFNEYITVVYCPVHGNVEDMDYEDLKEYTEAN